MIYKKNVTVTYTPQPGLAWLECISQHLGNEWGATLHELQEETIEYRPETKIDGEDDIILQHTWKCTKCGEVRGYLQVQSPAGGT